MGRLESEVKLKFDCGELEGLLSLLESRGLEFRGAVREVDLYYSHPCRDFAVTDEAVRLRITSERWTITYKGPRMRGKGHVKSRLEVEAHIEGGSGEALKEILERLGFREAVRVKKWRWRFSSERLHVTVDLVEGLGCFLEVEGEENALVEAVKKLSLKNAVAVDKTYAEMLMEKEGVMSPSGQSRQTSKGSSAR